MSSNLAGSAISEQRRALRVRLVASRLQGDDAILERGVIEIGDAAFDRVMELQAQLRLGGATVMPSQAAVPCRAFIELVS